MASTKFHLQEWMQKKIHKMLNNFAYKNECKKIMHSQNAQQFYLQ
jgi:hypothetical protein